MPKPCGHDIKVEDCSPCKVFEERKDYRLMWSDAPAEEVWAASLEISKKNGKPPMFSAPDAELIKRSIPKESKCVHLGISVPNTEGGCRAMYECERGHGKVRPCVECKKCEDFAPEDVV